MTTDSKLLEILKLLRLPGRITATQAADLLGFQLDDISVLMAAKLIKPLGNPAKNGHKWFALVEIERLRADPKFLAKATDAVTGECRRRNIERKSHGPGQKMDAYAV